LNAVRSFTSSGLFWMQSRGRVHSAGAIGTLQGYDSQRGTPMSSPRHSFVQMPQMQSASSSSLTPPASPRTQPYAGGMPQSMVHSQSAPLGRGQAMMAGPSGQPGGPQMMRSNRHASLGSIPAMAQILEQPAAQQLPPWANAGQAPSPVGSVQMTPTLSGVASAPSVAQGQRRDSGSVAPNGYATETVPAYSGLAQSQPKMVTQRSLGGSGQQFYRASSEVARPASGLLHERDELPRFGGCEGLDLQDLLRQKEWNPPPLAGSIEGIIEAFTRSMKKVRTEPTERDSETSSSSAYIREIWAHGVSHAAIGGRSDYAMNDSLDMLGGSVSGLSFTTTSTYPNVRSPRHTPRGTPRDSASTPSLKAAAMAVRARSNERPTGF